jgi:hypothetical protein
MVFKLALSAQKHWRTLNGAKLLAGVIEGVRFEDGVRREAARPCVRWVGTESGGTMAPLTLMFMSAVAIASQVGDRSCPSAEILGRLWHRSFSAVEQATSAADRGGSVSLSDLRFHVETLGAISGIAAEGNYFGYLPDTGLSSYVAKWRTWRSDALKRLCEKSSPGAPVAREGCVGQERLARLWLDNTRSLERILQDAEHGVPIDTEAFSEEAGFFAQVTGLSAENEADMTVNAWSKLKLTALAGNWQDWFARHVGGMRTPLIGAPND